MAAVAANPHSFSNINNPAWGMNGGQSLNAMNSDDVRGMFLPRKNIQRTNSSSSIASNASTSSSSTLVSSNGSTNGSTNGAPVAANPGELNGGWPTATPRKRQQPKGAWPAARADGQPDLSRMAPGRQQMVGGLNGNSALHQQSAFLQPQGQLGQLGSQTAMSRPMMDPMAAASQPVLYLLSLNGTFERKTIAVPFSPDTLRIGRQTNMKTVPTPINGYFDSKVLSRQHAEIWADRQGKIWIRDIKSSNGTFVNGTRLSAENRESEPHELQTADHLELGIDIVSEDQKSVVHHKVAAKVEHAGFLSSSNSLLDMSFGELDPANGGLMPQVGGLQQFRGRTSSQSSMGSSVRVPQAAGMSAPVSGMAAFQRGLWLNQPSTEAIVKKLHQEMRNARLQSQDLARTNAFINALLSKEDVKNDAKPEGGAEPPRSQMPNGNSASFRADPKARFSDPPAPPPQQPLPEKPVAARPANDVPSLKRGTTERPKSQPPNTSPIRPDHSEITQLQEALYSAKKEIDTQHAQMRDLEEMLLKEREARKTAEELARRLGDAVSSKRADEARQPDAQGSILEETFEPPLDATQSPEADPPVGDSAQGAPPPPPQGVENAHASLFARIDTMAAEMKALKEQVEEFKVRAETAEVERDTARESLAEMIKKIRLRDEEEEAKKAARRTRSVSRGRKAGTSASGSQKADAAVDGASSASAPMGARDESLEGQPTLSRANTITPANGQLVKTSSDPATLAQSVPYASMIGVVLLGMGLMAYLNGWQAQPHLDR